MKELYPLDIKISQTHSSDCPTILHFGYKDSKGNDALLRYEGRRLPKTEEYLNREKIEPDFSEVKTKEDAEKFKSEFMKQYPDADKVYENLYKYEKDDAKTQAEFDKVAVFNDCVFNHIDRFMYNQLPKDEQVEAYDYLKEALKIQSQGKNLDEQLPVNKRGLAAKLGFKRDNLYLVKKEIKETIEKFKPEKYAKALSAIANELPKEPYPSFEELDKANEEYHKKWRQSGNITYDSFKKVADDFLTIKVKEDAEKALDKKLTLHLKNLRTKEKVAQKAAERAQKKAENEPINKAAGLQKQAEAKKRTDAKKRLQQKGLVSQDERSGKSQHWGDSITLMKKQKEKSNG